MVLNHRKYLNIFLVILASIKYDEGTWRDSSPSMDLTKVRGSLGRLSSEMPRGTSRRDSYPSAIKLRDPLTENDTARESISGWGRRWGK